ncbi:MAG: hydrogenase iron-sulfur subunit [Desulfobacteraceae bacterium]|nr:MAG: hydrogenase iron-sulfur subunit [Desulfobacteraceae bacterium]
MTGRVCIAGDGPCAVNTAKELLIHGIDTVLVSRRKIAQSELPDNMSREGGAGISVYGNAEISGCSGCVNDFRITIHQNGAGAITENVTGIVIAEEYQRKDNFETYGLKPSHAVTSLSEMVRVMENKSDQVAFPPKGSGILFLTGCFQESNPVVLYDVMNCALQLRKEYHQDVFILTGNLKVAGEGLEALYRQTRTAGVFYIKVNQVLPEIEQSDEGKVTVSCQDEILHTAMRLSPDLVVVDETLLPSEYLMKLAKVFELNQDKAGFLQSDNVHRNPVFTNRRGVLVVGPSRGILERREILNDVGNVTIAMMNQIRGKIDSASVGKARIGVVECARCLTCFRICPYKAIRLEDRVTVYEDACEGCGICIAECPREYITWTGPGMADELEKIQISGIADPADRFSPVMVAFCCQRSAGRSVRTAKDRSPELPEGLKIVEVPCAGGISTDHILRTFQKGADGIILLTCHPGNCHSEVGNQYAKSRADHVGKRLSAMGFEKERLQVDTIAANMDREFVRVINSFQKKLMEIGPSLIRKSLKH